MGGFKHMAAVLADVQHGEEGGWGQLLAWGLSWLMFNTGRKGGGDNSWHGEEGGWGQFSPPKIL